MCSMENHNPKHPCKHTPLEQAEEELVAICIKMGKIPQPLSVLRVLNWWDLWWVVQIFRTMLHSSKWCRNFAQKISHVVKLEKVGDMCYAKELTPDCYPMWREVWSWSFWLYNIGQSLTDVQYNLWLDVWFKDNGKDMHSCFHESKRESSWGFEMIWHESGYKIEWL